MHPKLCQHQHQPLTSCSLTVSSLDVCCFFFFFNSMPVQYVSLFFLLGEMGLLNIKWTFLSICTSIYLYVFVYMASVFAVFHSWLWVGQDVWYPPAAHDAQSGDSMVSVCWACCKFWEHFIWRAVHFFMMLKCHSINMNIYIFTFYKMFLIEDVFFMREP